MSQVSEETLPDRQRFEVSAEQWEAFQAALSAAPQPAPRLVALLQKPSVLERGDLLKDVRAALK